VQEPGRKRGPVVLEQAYLIEEMESSEAVRRVLAAGALEGSLGTRMPCQNGEIGPGPITQKRRQERLARDLSAHETGRPPVGRRLAPCVQLDVGVFVVDEADVARSGRSVDGQAPGQ
jgi:hypothetical protein